MGEPLTDQALVVSIIINNYNYDRFLRAAIDSAVGQSYRPLEVIVVDDGSIDHSRDIICSYSNQITPILKENGGQASALNAGFAQSHGDIVIFLDADDVLLPEAARLAAEVFLDKPHVSKVMYRMEIIDATGRRTGAIKPADYLRLPSGDLSRQILAFPFDMTWMPTSGNAFSGRVLHQIFPIPAASFRILADFYLSHVTPLFGPVVFLEEVGGCYRIHGHNNYESADRVINLDQVRRTIIYASHTETQIERYARQLGFGTSGKKAARGVSVSIVANRLISLKLDPVTHPIQGDNAWRLFRLGVTAALGRFDVKWPMRLMFVLWFLTMVMAPRSMAPWLAERFLYPEKRKRLNQVLRLFHGRINEANTLQLIDDEP